MFELQMHVPGQLGLIVNFLLKTKTLVGSCKNNANLMGKVINMAEKMLIYLVVVGFF